MATGGIEPVAFEPHMLEKDKPDNEILERSWGLRARVDPSVTFEEYVYWAKIERAEEWENNKQYIAERGPVSVGKVITGRFSKGVHHDNKKKLDAAAARSQELQQVAETTDSKEAPRARQASVTAQDEEWKTASRALRTASWGTIFYLITTDILGWSNCPFVFASVGFGPGFALYIVFGLAAALSGWILWQVFLGLDSSRYPMQSFGDTYYRVFGAKSRHFINVTQALQQFMTVAVLILASAQIIAQLSSESICFVACMIIVMVIGMVLGSVRSLQRLGWLCNASVWLNIISFIIM